MSRFRNVRRGRCPHRPKGSYEFAESFRKNRIFCGRTESSAPTDSLRFSRFRVGVDAHIDPAERTDFTITFGEFVIAKWGDVGIAPTQIWNPSSEKRTAVLVKQQSVFYLPSSMRKSLLAFSLVALPISSGVSPRSCAIFAATKGTSDGSLRRPR